MFSVKTILISYKLSRAHFSSLRLVSLLFLGLFVADQKPGSGAKNTRQNPNGNRYGLECPEERDYHPYWHPSPWWDIATLAQDQSLCPYYQSESFNVKPKRELSTLCYQNFFCKVIFKNFKKDILNQLKLQKYKFQVRFYLEIERNMLDFAPLVSSKRELFTKHLQR